MFLHLILFIVGFIVLIKGADIFVDGAANIATNFKVSKMLIGLTIVAFGTSAPEFAVSVKSIITESGDIVLGNVIGSNILNILLILGISSLFHTLYVKKETIKKELPIMILITLVFILLLLDNVFDKTIVNSFTRNDGLILLSFFSIFIYYLIKMSKRKSNEILEPNMSLIKSIAFTIVGILSIIVGSNFVVDNAVNLALILGVSERLISLTIIAFGTSLPELVTSVVATKKGEHDIAIGNIVGSNLFNIGIVIGLPVVLFGNISNVTFNYIDLFVMLLSVLLLFAFSFKNKEITKKEGIIFLLLFIGYYSYIILSFIL